MYRMFPCMHIITVINQKAYLQSQYLHLSLKCAIANLPVPMLAARADKLQQIALSCCRGERQQEEKRTVRPGKGMCRVKVREILSKFYNYRHCYEKRALMATKVVAEACGSSWERKLLLHMWLACFPIEAIFGNEYVTPSVAWMTARDVDYLSRNHL